jgi:DNA polymerase-2
MHEGVPVLNRYYGVFENGKIKVRGIEARRRDTPDFIREAQLDVINVLGRAVDSKGFMARVPEALGVLKGYVRKLVNGEVTIEDLFVTKQLSMDPSDYVHNVFQVIAARQLVGEGIEISGGQTVRYLITDAESKRLNRRVRAAELVDENTRYDVRKYLELLLAAGANILSPFGYTSEKLHDLVVRNQRQIALH